MFAIMIIILVFISSPVVPLSLCPLVSPVTSLDPNSTKSECVSHRSSGTYSLQGATLLFWVSVVFIARGLKA